MVKYITDDNGGRFFDIKASLKEHWNIDYKNEESLIGIKLKGRKKPSLKARIVGFDWVGGVLRVHYNKRSAVSWDCLDHSIENFEIDK